MNPPLNRRNWLKIGLGAFISLALILSAIAANVHFKSDPTFTDIGFQLKSCLALSGLGNQDVTITVAVTGTGSVTFSNPGSNQPPGQNKVPISAVVTKTVPSTQIKNGTLSICLTTAVPEEPTPKEAGAPNNNWTVDFTDISFSTATITVVQGGKVVLMEQFNLAS